MKNQTDRDDTGNGRPTGVPLGRAFLIRPGLANDDLREVVAAIERVHGDGVLPRIPMSMVGEIVDSRRRRADGLFTFEVNADGILRPRSIQVSSGVPNRLWITLHEVGHFLDARGLPGRGYASGDREVVELARWRGAVAQSRAVQALQLLRHAVDADTRQHAEELVTADELWARSYAQFVAIRSGNPTMLRSLDSLRHRGNDVELYFPLSWEDTDFAAIEAAIDELFRDLGWIA